MPRPWATAFAAHQELTVKEQIDQHYRAHSRRVLAILIRLLGDFNLAEEGLHEAFRAALERWPSQGLPANPVAWLVSAGRFKVIDSLRQRKRFAPLDDHLEEVLALPGPEQDENFPGGRQDDRLRLIFTCCHPALAPDAQVALTLREVCGLPTEAIARAFLVPTPTLAQRIVRAKVKIAQAKIPYEVPEPSAWPERLPAVLRVIYLVFNEGYASTGGAPLDLASAQNGADENTAFATAQEAIRLTRLLLTLMQEGPPPAELWGLLALMLLHESRRAARSDAQGQLVLLAEQDRSLWQHDLIREGQACVERALAASPWLTPQGSDTAGARRDPGPYTVQALIAACHSRAEQASQTDWAQIVSLYDLLLQAEPSPVVQLNRAVALFMHQGPAAALPAVHALVRGPLERYAPAHVALAEMRWASASGPLAVRALETALALSESTLQSAYLARRLAHWRKQLESALQAAAGPQASTLGVAEPRGPQSRHL